MGAFDTHPNASHRAFPYYFDETEGITFGTSFGVNIIGDLLIYYDTYENNDFIDCWCSRWDVDNYSVIVETWLKEDDLSILLDNITPGATDELYSILGRPYYYDKTWASENTIKLKPNIYTRKVADSWIGNNNSSLKNMRDECMIFVKNITTHPIVGSKGWIQCKIEGYKSGSGAL